MDKNKTIAIILGVLVLLGAAFAISTYRQAKEEEVTKTNRVTLAGEYACIPRAAGDTSTADECLNALKTDTGSYYLLDFNLASQTPPALVLGDRLEASGVVTIREALSSSRWQMYSFVGIFSVTDSARKLNDAPIAYMCHSDGKMCADGSVVGRTGSDCHFTACPLIAESGGSIYGTVLLGPTCPVEQYPPDPKCADRPYETRLALTTEDGARVIREFSSDAAGKFRIDVPVGSYSIRPAAAANILPYCSSAKTIIVPANDSVEADVFCDSGIR